MKEIKTVFVDCDGVLYDSSCLTYEQMVEACRRAGIDLGIDWTQAEAIHNDLKAQGIRGLYNTTLALCKQYGVTFKEISERMVTYVDYRQLPQDLELLDLLKQVSQKRTLNIYTNNTRPHLERIFKALFNQTLEQTGIQAITAESTLWDGYFHVKEHTNAFTIWCQKLKTLPEGTLLLDDTPGVIEAAKKQGLQTIQTIGSSQAKEILKGLL